MNGKRSSKFDKDFLKLNTQNAFLVKKKRTGSQLNAS
jgi:hypothetical protein